MTRSFYEWLLLERALDQQMRAAAARAFDKFHSHTMLMVKAGCDSFVRDTASSTVKFDQRGDEHTLASNLMVRIHQANGVGGNVLLTSKRGNVMIVHYCVMRESELVLPPSITIQQYRAAFPDHSPHSALIMFGLESKKKGGVAGEYHTGRTITHGAASFVGQPMVKAYGIDSLSFDDGVQAKLRTMIKNIQTAKAEGKSAQGMMRHINKWLKDFDHDLLSCRSTFVHEYIHFLDDLRYKSKSSAPGNIKKGIDSAYDKEDKDKKAYWLSDSEWNAHFQASAESVEDAFSSFLIAATSNRSAVMVAGMNRDFDTMTPVARCRLVADFVADDLMRVINRALGEDWVAPALKDYNLEGVNLRGIHRYVLLMVALQSRGTAKFMFKDADLRMRFVNRIMSLVQDLQGIITAYKTRMSQGKAYTAREYAAARNKFPAQGLKREHDPYNMMYTGMMMGKSKPFDPKKPYRSDHSRRAE